MTLYEYDIARTRYKAPNSYARIVAEFILANTSFTLSAWQMSCIQLHLYALILK